jgi:hypothetical protein
MRALRSTGFFQSRRSKRTGWDTPFDSAMGLEIFAQKLRDFITAIVRQHSWREDLSGSLCRIGKVEKFAKTDCLACDLRPILWVVRGQQVMLMGSLGTVATQHRSSQRYALLKQLCEISREVFPDIEIRIQKADASFHAQAYVLEDRHIVTLFGGLAFHRCLQKDGLLFTILHEIGHHVAPGPRITPTDPRCCDCAADCWAVGEGRRLFSSRGITLDVRSALNEIELALSALKPGYDLSSGRRCSGWSRRKAAMTSSPVRQVMKCEFRETYR